MKKLVARTAVAVGALLGVAVAAPAPAHAGSTVGWACINYEGQGRRFTLVIIVPGFSDYINTGLPCLPGQ